MPSFASANQSGIWYAASDSRDPLNGPDAMAGRGAVIAGAEACARARDWHNGELTPAAVRADVCRNLRRENVFFMPVFLLCVYVERAHAGRSLIALSLCP